jgi:fused
VSVCLFVSVLPVGNAAFHSAELYPLLSRSIEPLTVSLRDDDDKTRANAAGAIGNLIRNGGELSQLMADLRVVEMLIFMLVNDADITAQRIALFSLGTMAVYPATRSGAFYFPDISLIAFRVWGVLYSSCSYFCCHIFSTCL